MFGTGAFGADVGAVNADLLVTQAALNEVPLDYNGFSVEKSQLADTAFYAAGNTSLIALHRRLSPSGVLRIGGNTSEFCWWKATPATREPLIRAPGVGRSDNWMPQHHVGITPEAVEHLRAFLDACGWTCIWGLNFGTATTEHNAEEAATVAAILGPRLRSFQIGNEPDLYMTPDNMLRPAGWGLNDYIAEWSANALAVIGRVPDAKFGGPDASNRIEWLPQFAEEARKRIGDHLAGISAHYYVGGPPSSPDMTIPHLMQRDPKVAATMDLIEPVIRSTGLPFRITEANSCYRGGKPGMSNTLAAALWGVDYALYLASRGCKGVNFHGGPGSQIAKSIGDKMPGAQNEAEMAYAKLGSFYSPFAGTPAGGYDARPLFYGMMLVEQFAGSTMVANSFNAGGVNAAAFTATKGGELIIAIVNKDEGRDLAVKVGGAAKPASATGMALTAKCLAASEGLTFAGDVVAHGSADWQAKAVHNVLRADGSIFVPRASALLARLKGHGLV